MKRQSLSLSFFLFCAFYGGLAVSSPASVHVRHPAIEGAPNFRDLGGYRTIDGRTVKWGLLYRSDALDELTLRDMQYIDRLNIGKIVDFRQQEEVERNPDRLAPDMAMRRVSLPTGKAPQKESEVKTQRSSKDENPSFNDLDEEAQQHMIDRFLITEMYPGFVRNDTPAFRTWLHGLLDTPGSAQVFHCTGGADRTGFAAAIVLLALGVPKDLVLKDYLLTNKYLFNPHGRAYLDKRMDIRLPPSMRLHSRYLVASFNQMQKQYGSIDNYLREGLGIDKGFRERLRARLLD